MNAVAEWRQGHRQLRALAGRTKWRLIIGILCLLLFTAFRSRTERTHASQDGIAGDAMWSTYKRQELDRAQGLRKLTLWASLHEPQKLVPAVGLLSLAVNVMLVVRDRRRLLRPELSEGVLEVVTLPPDSTAVVSDPASVKPQLAGLARLVRDVRRALSLGERPTAVVISSQIQGLTVSECGETIKCVLPLGFLKEASRQPLRARSKLAHEFSHVVQGDTRLWLWICLHARYVLLQTLFVELPLVLLIVAGMHGDFLAPLDSIHGDDVPLARDIHKRVVTAVAFMGLVAAPVLVLTQYSKLMRSRQLAEFSADRAALIYGDAGEYLSFLSQQAERYASHWPDWFALHPSPRRRLRQAREFAQRHRLTS